ncbi:MAG: cation diffusion facilitator family transporter [Proteobacteria bacterium]|nr:cation diffusion facilitator family transporter [Pseudomonadota bacterium]
MQQTPVAIKPKYALFAGAASLVTVAVLIIAKSIVYWHGGSVAVLASLTDSIIDAAMSGMNFMAIRYSLKPADEEHRHGHGKAEGLAAMFQGAFIFGAGVFLVFESLARFAGHAPAQEHWGGISVMVFAIVLSAALVAIQNYSLRRAPSLAVEAEKAHYSGDIIINGGVIAVLLALSFGAPNWIDPAFALVVAGWLAYTAWGIVKKGVDMLLDRELPDAMRARIFEIASAHKEVRAVHDLRTRKSGMQLYISFDIETDPEMSLRKAHAVSLAVEHAVHREFPNAEIMIHVDPHGIPHDETRHNVAGVHS